METPRRSSVSYETTPRRSNFSPKSGYYGSGDRLGHDEYDSERPPSAERSRDSFSSPMSVGGAIFAASPVAVVGGYPGENFGRRYSSGKAHQVKAGSFVQTKSFRTRAPPLPILLKFVDVRYSAMVCAPSDANSGLGARLGFVQSHMVEKEIIHGVTGTVSPGEILALMGPSGSGKTTFLKLLGGRIPCTASGSTISYNDVAYCKPLQGRIGFVTQDDVLYPHLTVKETLVYAAMLRLPRTVNMADKIRRAEDIIFELRLDSCQDTIIGDTFLRGVSGGERKRVCVGHEILNDPSLLFLDEPTSGLDSTTALCLIQVLRNIAEAGRTVVTTIHQPSSKIFSMFDKLIVLAQGSPVYSGEANDCMDYFHTIGLTPLIPMNPADFLLDVSSGIVSGISIPLALQQLARETPKNAHSNMEAVQPAFKDVMQYLVESYTSIVYPAEQRSIFELGEVKDELRQAINEKRVWSTSWWTQFSVLFVRGLKERRHEYMNVLRFAETSCLALAAGLLWLQSKHDTDSHLRDQMGLIFNVVVFWSFLPLFVAIITFPQERAMLAKERAADMYRLSAYFMSRTLGDVPLEILLPVTFIVISYFMAHLTFTVEAFILTNLVLVLDVLTSQGLGLAIGAWVVDTKRAAAMGSVISLAFVTVGGYVLQHIPEFMKWLKYMSIQYYGFQLLLKVQYNSSQKINCASHAGCNPIGESPALNGIKLGGGLKEVLTLLGMLVLYRVIAYIGLRRTN